MAEQVFLGSVYGEIELRNKTDQGLKEAEGGFMTAFKSIGNRFDEFNSRISDLGSKMSIGITAPLSVIGKTSTDVAIDVEKAWKGVEKVFDGSAETIDKYLKPAVSELTNKFGRNKLEVIEVTDQLASMGYAGENASDIIDVLTNVMEAATAGNMELSTAVANTIAISKIYNVTGSELTAVLAKLNTVENLTSASAQDLGEAIQISGDIANVSGVSIDQFSGFVAALRARAIPAGEAANGLKSIFTSLQKPTDDVKDLMKEFNIQLYDSKGNAKGAGNVLEQLSKIWNKLTDEQQSNLAISIAGTYQVSKFTGLMGDLTSQNSEYFKVLGNVNNRQQNLVDYQREISIFLDQTSTKVAKSKAKWGELQEAIGAILINALIPVQETFQTLIGMFLKLDPNIQKFIVTFGAILAVIGPILLIIPQIVAGFSSLGLVLSSLFGIVGAVASALASPLALGIGAVVGGLVLLVKGLMDAYNSSATFRSMIQGVVSEFTGFKGGVGSAIDVVKNKWNGFVDSFKAGFGNIVGNLTKGISGGILSFAGGLTGNEELKEQGKSQLSGLGLDSKQVDQLQQLITTAGDMVRTFKDTVIPIIERVRSTLITWWETAKPIFEQVGAFAQSVWEKFVTFVQPIADLIIPKLIEIFNNMKLQFEANKNLFMQLWPAIEMVGKVLLVVAAIILGVIIVALALVGALIIGVVYAFLWLVNASIQVGTFLTNLATTIITWFQNIPNMITDTFNKVVQWFQNLPASIMKYLNDLLLGIIFWAGFLSVWLPDATMKMINAVVAWFQQLPTRVGSFLNNTRDAVTNRFNETRNFLASAVPQMIDGVVNWFKGLPQRIYDGISNMSSLIGERINQAKDNMWNAVQKWTSDAFNWGRNLMNSFVDGLKSVAHKIGDTFKQGQAAANKFIESHSPPSAGPWKDIDKYGYNVGKTWADNLSMGISNIDIPSPDAMFINPEISAPKIEKNSGLQQQMGGDVNINVDIGMYAGSAMEKREIAVEIYNSLKNVAQSKGINLNLLGEVKDA